MFNNITLESLTEYEAILLSRHGIEAVRQKRLWDQAYADQLACEQEDEPEWCPRCGTYFAPGPKNHTLCYRCRKL